MKTLLLSASLFILSYLSQATVITVSNDPAQPAQKTTLIDAVNAASAGDTIYVQGSATNYGAVTFNKQLVFIGPGAKPNKQNPLAATVNSFTLDTLSGISGASGSIIEGFNISSGNAITTSGNYNNTTKLCKNITISRNMFTPQFTANAIYGGSISNCLITNNIFIPFNGGTCIYIGNNSNYTIKNNIFSNVSSITTSNKSSVTIDHNLFLGNGSNYTFSTLSFAVISNNIFLGLAPGSSATSSDITNCAFNHNLTFSTAKDTIPYGTTNVGDSSNLIARNPLLVNTPTMTFNYSYDYHVQAGSPGHNAATDGTDLGIYGGAYPFVDLTGSVNIPQVTQMNIPTGSIPIGGSLNVQIKAKKHD